ncbi:MAG: hypothetical protein PVG07_00845 [Acidobacteriota bacterium]|jgi:hypothetical protein
MRSKRNVVLAAAILIAVVLVVAPWAAAQTPSTDLTGTYDMQATVELPSMETPAAQTKGLAMPCQYEGTADIVDENGDLSGTVDLMLVTGPEGCPADMTGTLNGSGDPGTTDILVMGTIGGTLGMLTFNGSLTPNPGGGGTFSVTQGGFVGAVGSWAAQRFESIFEIPTLTAVGLTLLTLLVLGAGYFILRHAAA